MKTLHYERFFSVLGIESGIPSVKTPSILDRVLSTLKDFSYSTTPLYIIHSLHQPPRKMAFGDKSRSLEILLQRTTRGAGNEENTKYSLSYLRLLSPVILQEAANREGNNIAQTFGFALIISHLLIATRPTIQILRK